MILYVDNLFINFPMFSKSKSLLFKRIEKKIKLFSSLNLLINFEYKYSKFFGQFWVVEFLKK